MKGMLLPLLIIAALCLMAFYAGSPQAMEQNIAGIESQADSIARMFSKYGWPVVAVVLSPLLSWRIFQWLKLAFKRQYGYKPHWLMLDAGSWSVVFGLTYWAWSIHAENAEFIALIVACFHTAIVKYIFAKAPKQIVDALSYGASSDHTMLTIFAGKDRRQDDVNRDLIAEIRGEKTRVLTEAERNEITNPKSDG